MDFLSLAFEVVSQNLVYHFCFVFEVIWKNLVDSLSPVFKGVWRDLGDPLCFVFEVVWKNLVDSLSLVSEVVSQNRMDHFCFVFEVVWKNLVDSLRSVFKVVCRDLGSLCVLFWKWFERILWILWAWFLKSFERISDTSPINLVFEVGWKNLRDSLCFVFEVLVWKNHWEPSVLCFRSSLKESCGFFEPSFWSRLIESRGLLLFCFWSTYFKN